MANELRVVTDGLAGAITDNPLSNVATTINSAGLADLPAIGSTQHAALTLFARDSNGRVTAREVVYVTAHTASATSATIVRGQEGTTAQSWVLGSFWVHGVTARDLPKATYVNRMSSNITLNSGSWANVDTGTDLTLTNVQVGDLVEVNGSWLTAGSTTTATFFDAVSIISGSPVNSWGLDGAVTVGGEGIQAWRCDSNSISLNQRVSGGMMRRVVSGDLASGVLTLRLRYKQPSATNVTLYNDTTRALQFRAKNHRA